jgi:hypothetical protein
MEHGVASNQEPAKTDQQSLWVGKDHLTITEHFVVIDAVIEMPDWEVREFQRVPIFLGEVKFFLRQKAVGEKPFAWRYLLERWPQDAHFSAAPLSFTYDEEFVRERDAEHSRAATLDKLSRALLCLYPLLGFLWSGTKKKLIPAGFVPRTITGVSIFSCLCLLLLQGTFIRMRVGLVSFLFGNVAKLNLGLLVADYVLFGLMLLDIVFRFDQHVRSNTEYPWGFCEWITAPFRRKPADEEEQA